MTLKYGRKPPKQAMRLRFSQFAATVPPHPASVDYLKALKNWLMLGNDNFGDCVAVMFANGRRLVSATIGAKEYYPSQDEVFALYRTQNPNFVANPNNPVEDNGMDIQTALEWLQKNPWGGSQIVAFASVDHTNLEELKAAIATFGFVLPGINVQAANETQFNNGQPWDYVKGSRVLGGHAILAGGYGANAKSDVNFVTWAKETSFTDAEIAKEWQECWVAIYPEHFGNKQFLAGVDQNALAAAFLELTGKVLVIPTPTPVPTPTAGTWQITEQSATRVVIELK